MSAATHLACPVSHGSLREDGDALVSPEGRRYPAAAGSWDLRPDAGDDNNALQAEIYDAKLGEFTDFDHPHNLMLVHQRQLLETLTLSPGDRVLEMGAHRSGVLPWLEKHRGIVGSGVDIAAGWVGAQNAAAVARGSATRWYVGDAEHLPFADASFAGLVAFDVLEHVSNLDHALAECARVLRPGGRMVCHLPVADIDGSWDGLQRWWDAEGYAARQAAVGHFHDRLPTRIQFATRLEQVGFHVADTRSFNVWVQPLHDHRVLAGLGTLRKTVAGLRGPPSGPWSAGSGQGTGQPGASAFQRAYARIVVPVVKVLALPDRLGSLAGIGGSCSFVAEKIA